MGGSDHCPCVTLPLPSSLPPSLPPQPPYPYQEVMPKLTPRTRVLYAFGESPAQDLDLINRAINRRGCEASSSLPHNGEGREAGNGGRWEGREKSQKKLKL
ncbi:hypothetical protein Naga_100794g1 [Nannochloropsis gaditana]|uniref:Uncharacterized protein n=1 Tax=Nannochloropsis gaditana TaxID=72520 RepID=W7TLB1_9STRA|nr:hypothetical protein Naga_100794g1 [Nannochloropsis gaditana]